MSVNYVYFMSRDAHVMEFNLMKPVSTASDPKLILAGIVLEMLMFLGVCLAAPTSVLPIIVSSGFIFNICFFLNNNKVDRSKR